MEFTPEQELIFSSKQHLKINAVAGSGKTTTIIEYARQRTTEGRILYIAFNRSVRQEASKRFHELGIQHVKVETAHSLAFRYIVQSNLYKIKANGYSVSELIGVLGLKIGSDKLGAYVLAAHILKFTAYFCNSNKSKVQDLNYSETITDPKAFEFVQLHYLFIEKQTRLFLAKMDKGEIDIMHDFYLKKFQLVSPDLPYEYILFDEGQDASPAMLDVFFKQKACKIIVGDIHQQIYSWRYAINSLDKVNFDTRLLSTSFRFSQEIADLAMNVLAWKKYLTEYSPIEIFGKGKSTAKESKAVLARTNLGLLIASIKYLGEHPQVKKIYFEGNLHSYTYADDGASLYDVLNLYNYQHDRIKDPLIKSMKNMDELDEYIEKSGDHQLAMMVSLVREYENEIYDVLRELKEKHVGNDEREKADIIFSTVHRCKGLEYDIVTLADDFITEGKVMALEKKLKEDSSLPTEKMEEEINLLYVAVTRTKNLLYLPEELLPIHYIPNSKVKLLPTNNKNKPDPKPFFKNTIDTSKKWKDSLTALTVEDPWIESEDLELIQMVGDEMNVYDISNELYREVADIRKRIKYLKKEGRL